MCPRWNSGYKPSPVLLVVCTFKILVTLFVLERRPTVRKQKKRKRKNPEDDSNQSQDEARGAHPKAPVIRVSTDVTCGKRQRYNQLTSSYVFYCV